METLEKIKKELEDNKKLLLASEQMGIVPTIKKMREVVAELEEEFSKLSGIPYIKSKIKETWPDLSIVRNMNGI